LTIVRLFEVLAYDRKIIKGRDAIFSPLSVIGAAGNIPFPICHTVLPTFYKFIMRLMRMKFRLILAMRTFRPIRPERWGNGFKSCFSLAGLAIGTR
jgi:hypothetical protein